MKTIFLMLLVISVSALAQTKEGITLSVIKDSSVKVDEMILEISVYKADTASIAANRISHTNLADVLGVLKKWGYNDESIYLKESNFSSNYYQKPNNFSSLQTYRVIFTKFELYDQLKKELIDAGATGVRIASFWSTKYKEIKKELYIKAISEAKEKARFLSVQMGLKHIQLSDMVDNTREESFNSDISFPNSPGTGIQQSMAMTVAAQGERITPTITNGQFLITVSLRITFKFE